MKNKRIILGLIIILIFEFALSANAAIVTWTNGGADTYASNADNWSTIALPQDEDNVVYDSTSTDDCLWSIDVIPASLNLDSGYLGTVTINSALEVTDNVTIFNGTMILNDNLIIGVTPPPPPGSDWDASLISTFGRPSYNTEGEMNYPSSVTVDNDGNVYICTDADPSINKFDAQGNFITRWTMGDCFGLEADAYNNIYVAARFEHKMYKFDSDGNVLAEWGSRENGDGQFYSPNDVAINNNLGLVYVADTRNLRVQVFDTDGNFQFKWGSQGNGNGQFPGPRGPLGITVDESNGAVYVTDADGYRVQKFDQNGNFLLKWGSAGNGEDQFYWPRNIEVDSSGLVYVVDGDNERIQVFDSVGNLVMVIKGEPYIYVPGCTPHLSHTDCTTIHNIEDGPFHPRDVAVDPQTGYIYVTATYAWRIDKFDPFGNYILSWGWWEANNGVFNRPSGMAIDLFEGYIYVADTYNHIIQKFDLNGNFLTSWGHTARLSTIWDGGDGSFDFPVNLTVDDEGNIYVVNPSASYPADPEIRRIQKFDQNGTFLGGWNYNEPQIHTHSLKGIIYNPFNSYLYVASTKFDTIQSFDTNGNFMFEFGGAGQFNFPTKIAVNRNNGYIYVIDDSIIKKFQSDGTYVSQWGGYGAGDGQLRLDEYSGMYVDDNGYVYVADSTNKRIQVFDSDGNYFVQLYVGGTPAGIVVDSSGKVYVEDRRNQLVDIYSPIPPPN